MLIEESWSFKWMKNPWCLRPKDIPLSSWRGSMKISSQNRATQSPHSQTLSLVLGGHNQLLSLVLNPHIQTLSLVLGGSNMILSISEAPWEPSVKLLTLKKRLLGGNPMLYFIYSLLLFYVFCRLMIMRSHKINEKSKNRMKNRKKNSTPWRTHLLAFKRQWG